MPPAFDPYRDWLGITETKRPLTHYQLLRLKTFEDDTSQIRNNFHKLNAHVRKQLGGKAAEQAHKLLGELTKAMLCLTDHARKSEYDASLGRKDTSAEGKQRSLEDLLVGRKLLTKEQLGKAQALARATGFELRDAVIQQKLAAGDAVMQAYADSLGLPYVELGEIALDDSLLPKLPAVLARQHSCVPIALEGGLVHVASPNPLRVEVEEELRLRFGAPVRAVICTPASIHAAVNKYYPREAAAAQMGVTAVAKGGNVQAAASQLPPEERKKRKLQVTLVAAMFSFVGFVLVGTLVLNLTLLPLYGGAFLLAAVAAGIAWLAA